MPAHNPTSNATPATPPSAPATTRVRVWDLPTRLFHWLLAACVIALLITAQIGGDAMQWHLRLGHVVLALLLWRVVWGVVGSHWSRFASFVPTPRRLRAYLQGRGTAADRVGHTPLGALSVLAMLLVLAVQVGTGLVSDDEIAYAGPLVRWVSGDTVAWASVWHTGWGQWLVWGLIGLHILAIAYYRVVRRTPLTATMVHGQRTVPAEVAAQLPPLRTPTDTAAQRVSALLFACACAVLAYWVWTRAMF